MRTSRTVSYFKKIRNYGTIAGALMVRSFDRALKVGDAMASRGYTGQHSLFTYQHKQMPRRDWIIGILFHLSQHQFSPTRHILALNGGHIMKAIETINLTYTYPDGTKALENVNFTVEKGENIAILGPNGAGKSTLLHHLNGLLMPTSGKVYVLEKEVTKQNLDEIRQKVGLVFQDPDDQLFARTPAKT